MPALCGSTPRRRAASSGVSSTLSPSMRASPASGLSTVYSMRSVVDLPAPLGPEQPVMRPSGAVKLTPRTACTAPKCLASSRASITAAAR